LYYQNDTVPRIFGAVNAVEAEIYERFPHITPWLPEEVTFIHAQELLDRYPELTPKERENKAAEEYGAVFIIGIGAPLSDGKPHDGRAPDYDDWISPNSDGFKGLNGDLILWNPVLRSGFELSSMGIRVSPESLKAQLVERGCEERERYDFHRSLLEGKLPYSIGGGIGQSRLCMYLLQKAHIGEVQASIWPEDQIRACADAGIRLL
ncbi:MAG: aspartate--ammonia ligase, partial [Muribaculaceae bacterium]|nr:aspartate--ammonia ligase [Muribaculaceae bacterium]